MKGIKLMVIADLSKKCEVLSDIWTNYKNDDNLYDFVDYNLLGLATAYLVHNNLVDAKDEAVEIINNTFDFLTASTGIESLDDLEL
jgi:hypothetical protein